MSTPADSSLWQQSRLTTSTTLRRDVTVTLVCSGLSSALFLAHSLREFSRLKIILVCEIDDDMRTFLRRRFGRYTRLHKDMRQLFKHLSSLPADKLHPFQTDILEITAPCQGRTVLPTGRLHASQINNDLFDLIVDMARLIQPLVVLAEMTPPHRHCYKDHVRLAHDLRMRLGYSVEVVDRFPTYLCGDRQARERWIMIARKYNVQSLDILSVCSFPAQPVSTVLDDLSQIRPSSWIEEPWTQLYPDAIPIETPVSYAEFPRTGSVRAGC